MKCALIFGLALAGLSPVTAFAAEQATVTITSKTSGSNFEYDLTLKNTGTTNLGTLWFAWIIGQDYLSVHPSAETSPTGWNAPLITGGGSGDGFALQWVANTPLAPGGTLSGFSFTTTEAPSIVEGTSAVPRYAGIPTSTYFVYIGQPLTDNGFQSVAVATPEPAALGLLGCAVLPLLVRKKSA